MNATGVVDINSSLVRKDWMKEGMIQAASTSFWSPFTGVTKGAIVYQKKNVRAGRGDSVIFDYSGNLATEGKLGKEKATGTGEAKKKFSSSLGIQRGRYVVDNGDKFDAEEIDALDLTNHSNSRSILSDYWIRAKDQTLFDAAQGRLNSIDNSHIIRPNDRATVGDLTPSDTFSLEFLLDLELKVKEGEGFVVGGKRRPLDPYTTQSGEKVWVLVINIAQKIQLLKDPATRNILAQADVRGSNNMLIKGQLGKIGSFIIVEAPDFFGTSSSRKLTKSKVEISGLRKVDENDKFTGEDGFGTGVIANRALILGAGALQLGIGKDADYKFQESDDFGITSESALEVWFNAQKTQLIAEDEDYDEAKVGGFDWGVVAVDTYYKG